MLKMTENTFKLAGVKWTVLDKTEKGYLCIADSIGDKKFDRKCNDWKKSDLREYLNGDYLAKLEANISTDNIIPFQRDLLSLDGQTEYGTCMDKVSLLTVDEYRKYRALLPNTRDWWWLITPDSTACNDDSTWVVVVSPRGYINWDFCGNDSGVRPVCIFSSVIFESEEE